MTNPQPEPNAAPPPERIWITLNCLHEAIKRGSGTYWLSDDPEGNSAEYVAAALATKEAALIRLIEAKRDEWKKLDGGDGDWSKEIAAANEILSALTK